MPLTDQPSAASAMRPLRVRNRESNTTVFAKQVNGDPVKITFGAAGHTGDVQRCPVALAYDIDFLNSLEAGVLEVIDGPADIIADLTFETEQVRAERAAAASKVTENLDRRQDRDIVGTTCIAPLPEGRSGTCGRSVLQNARQQAEQPPLCSEHLHLAPNYHLVESGSRGEGATESRDGVVRREWRAVQIMPRRLAE